MQDLTDKDILKNIKTGVMGRNIIIKDRTGSTNDDIRELAKRGAPEGTVVLAKEQTLGRGRNGRHWHTPPGDNIAMSLLLRPSFPADKAPMLTPVMGLAIAKAIEELAECRAMIKWPNDIVLERRKVCGILTELHIAPGGGEYYVIIGAGINVRQQVFAEDIRDMAGSILTQTGKSVDRSRLIAAAMNAFEKDYNIFKESCSMAGLRKAYEDRLLNLGETVRVLDPAGEYQAEAVGTGDGGELIVRRADGSTERVYAGEVSVRGLYGYV
ncbi:biotin--[acetyl-CoA-carboxylase] ligase [Butyrivibrio sp. MC2013]|uniref:biotin--[acetyl-CoA-carboxylase] ligase n=1 Tax=Butyrivibrio sp. MC2013 TaxID=1280686 RepID=UPI000414A418|nr:biotin--[acetyl-CoA-carboxylase] ligase [Butyrivibrio sp. MC2013]